MRSLCSTFIASLFLASTLSGQSIQLESESADSAALLLGRVIDRGSYRIVDRDTLLARDGIITGDLVVLGARVTLEGRITGDVVVVDGELFVRPPASVGGRIAVLGTGGAFVSGLADAGEVIYLDPRNRIELRREADLSTVRVVEPPPPSTLYLPGAFGIRLPTYDRVDGLSLAWGPAARFGGRDTATLTIVSTLAFRSARRTVDGGVELLFRPGPRSLIRASATRATRTADGWIRGDLTNSAGALFFQSDARDYFESDEVSLTLSRTPPPPLIEGEGFIAPAVMLRVSRDRSLASLDPWTVFSDDDGWRPNPAIDDGLLASLVLSTTAGWRWPTSSFSGSLAAEWSPGGIGDFDFAQLSLIGSGSMLSLWNHQIAVAGYLLQPLGGREAPLQRWSHIGGSGTLPTLPVAHMRGDHLLFVESTYLAPLRMIQLPLVGEPALRLKHAAGAAWRSGDEMPLLEQNAGVGVQVHIFNAMLYTDPTRRPLDFTLTLGAQLGAEAGLPFF